MQIFKEQIDFLFYHLKIDTGRASCKQYYLPRVELKAYNITIDGKRFFGQPIWFDQQSFKNI